MTLLGNALLARLTASGRYKIVPFHGTGPEAEVIEIYHGLTMSALGRRDYKRDPRSAVTTVLAHCASKHIAFELDPAIRSFCENYNSGHGNTPDPDGSDALIALATAILYREGLGEEAVGAEDQHQRSVEGVIWRPTI